MNNYSYYSFLLIALLWFMPIQAKASNIVGDVNNDGEINISDVTIIIDFILSGNNNLTADINLDGEVTISDATTLIDLILRGGGEHSHF